MEILKVKMSHDMIMKLRKIEKEKGIKPEDFIQITVQEKLDEIEEGFYRATEFLLQSASEEDKEENTQ